MQRDIQHFPAAGEVVIFDRSWYNRARDDMFRHTHTRQAPWFVANSNDKKRPRLNLISHLLQQIPYEKVKREKVELPKRKVDAARSAVKLRIGRVKEVF
jgi:polyphosphate kinase 2 (PPK2 family)